MALELELEPFTMRIADRPLLSVCSHPGCTTVTMGGTCVEHDAPVNIEFPRGRPYEPGRREELAFAAVE